MRAFVFVSLILLLIVFSPSYALKETAIYMPAVQDTDYGQVGAMATLTVNVKEGSGHVYVDTWPLAKVDTQASARIAKETACDAIAIDCSRYDFFYAIRSDAEIVGGPSGGAAMAVATLASLLDQKINNHVLITGTINPDGSIGPIGGLMEKARVSSENGNVFLIPEGQEIVTVGNESIDLKKYALDNWNLSVIEVKDLKESFGRFTGYKIKDVEMEFTRTESYQKVMRIFGEDLLSHASSLQIKCLASVKTSKADYTNREAITKSCETSLDQAQDEFRKENYYSSASLSFSNSITYQYGIMLSSFLSSADKKEFTKDYLNSISNKSFDIKTTNIELYAIIEERYSEVQDNIDQAWKSYYSGNYTEALYYGSYAEERFYTAVLWDQHSKEFPNYITTSSDSLNAISNDAISDAYAVSTYANLLNPNPFSFQASDMIDKAREKQKKGNYYTAIIIALKAKSQAEIASEISGKDNYDYVLSLHKKSALIAINKTSSVIGQSYFEYAQTLESEDKSAALRYYTYSEKLSHLNALVNEKPVASKIDPTEYIEPSSSQIPELPPILNDPLFYILALAFLI